jgi:hypothetical protein
MTRGDGPDAGQEVEAAQVGAVAAEVRGDRGIQQIAGGGDGAQAILDGLASASGGTEFIFAVKLLCGQAVERTARSLHMLRGSRVGEEIPLAWGLVASARLAECSQDFAETPRSS